MKSLLKHVVVVVVFLAAAAIYFAPIAFQGKTFEEGDNQKARAMQTEVNKYKEQGGETILWSGQSFGGMPTYQFAGNNSGNLLGYVMRPLALGQSFVHPVVLLFLAMFLLYFSLLLLNVDWRISAIAAPLYAFMTYNVLLIEAGHSNKMLTMCYLAPVFASTLAVYRGKYLLGGLLLAFSSAYMLASNHLQISYYAFLLCGMLGLVQLVWAIVKKEFKQFAIGSAVAMAAFGAGTLCNIAPLWSTYEYSQETIRGGSDVGEQKGQTGLAQTYVFEYTPSVIETFSLLVPNFCGGTSLEAFANDEATESYKVVSSLRISPEQQQSVAQATSQYWGGKPFTTGPVYFGAGLIFLFVLGLFLVKDPAKWWLGIGSAFFIMLSWGDNFPALNLWLFNHFPMYNKFRDVSTTLNVVQVMIVLLGMLAVKDFLSNKIEAAVKTKALFMAGAVTGGLCVLAMLYSFMGTPTGPVDQQIREQLPELLRALQKDRAGLIMQDSLRSLFVVGLAFGALWLYLKGILKGLLAIVLIGLVSVADLWLVTSRHVTSENYVEKEEVAAPPATPADNKVMEDKDPNYRVLSLIMPQFDKRSRKWAFRSASPLSNAMPSLYHKSLGGYHAAKLRRYQEMAERYIIDMKAGRFTFMDHPNILNMLNTRYIIQSQTVATPNPGALGNAWFVDSILMVKTADEELDTIARFNPKATAIVQEAFAAPLQGLNIVPDSSDMIGLTSYHPEKLSYKYNCKNERLVVFSEVYYPPTKGWNTYIDGQLVPGGFTKVNYLLRGLRVPAGEHTIEMRFEPTSIYTGRKVAMVLSLLLLLAAGYMAFRFFRGLKDGGDGGEGFAEYAKAEKAEKVVETGRRPINPGKKGK